VKVESVLDREKLEKEQQWAKELTLQIPQATEAK
jgi:hypothetical protein